jgi:EAL domain-containing protein (putative c-di-GMP-specific phosphodiesterase class I)
MVVSGSDRLVKASIGVAASDGDRLSASVLLRNADIAMYATKHAGGGGSTVYRPEMSADLMARLETRRHLGEAVAQGHFASWLQPVVDLASHRLLGFEALARWERPGHPPLAPGSWIEAAEETGLIVPIDELVLRAAARQLVEWSGRIPGADRLDLAVNASGRSLSEPDVADRVLRVLDEEGLHPSRLVLEVTEGVLIDEAVGLRLQVLRDAGVRIALDDFGTGWSSLTYLRRFPVDVLKLDRSFVSSISGGSGAEAVPAAVLQLAAALGLDVVAEGIETPEQLQVLRRLGCRTAQGFLLGAPGPAEQQVELVRRGRIVGGPSVVAVHARPA